MQTADNIPSSIPPPATTLSVHPERHMVLSYQQPPLNSQRQVAAAVAGALVRIRPPRTFRMYHPRSLTDPITVQAYDRPVFFADDMGSAQSKSPSTGHKRTPTMAPTSSRHHTSSTSGSTRKQGRKRSASFSDFLPPHLIAPASNPSGRPAAAASATLAAPKPRRAGARGGSMIKSAPPSPPPYADEKKSSEWWSPTDPLLPSLPTQLPPPLPPKDYPASWNPQQQPSGGTWSPRVAMRLTARVLGRTLGAVKGGQRSREEPSGDNGWVVV